MRLSGCGWGKRRWGKKRAPTAATDFAPPLPGARSVVRIDQEAHRLISFSVAGLVEAVHHFYLQALPALGFAAAPAGEQANPYGKGLERIQVIAKGKGNGATSVVLMHRAVDRP